MNYIERFEMEEQKRLRDVVPEAKVGDMVKVYQDHKVVFHGKLIAISGKNINKAWHLLDSSIRSFIRKQYFVYDKKYRFEVKNMKTKFRKARLYYLCKQK